MIPLPGLTLLIVLAALGVGMRGAAGQCPEGYIYQTTQRPPDPICVIGDHHTLTVKICDDPKSGKQSCHFEQRESEPEVCAPMTYTECVVPQRAAIDAAANKGKGLKP